MTLDLKDVFRDVPASARKYGVIGDPVAHSISPAMHGAAIREFGLDAAYRAIHVVPADLDDFLVQAGGFLEGFNVTVPHKEAIRRQPALAGAPVGPLVRLSGAVNTLARRDGRWSCDNTDGPGFLEDLRAQGVDFAGRRVVLLGAGGSGHALLHAFHLLPEHPPAEVVLINRSAWKLDALLEEMSRLELRFRLSSAVGPKERRRALEGAALVVNTTSLGLKPLAPAELHVIDFEDIPSSAACYDLVYHRETEFLAAARKAGSKAVGGLGMLVHQGALSFEIWFGEELKKNAKYTASSLRQVMRGAAEEELKRRPST